MKPSIIQKSNSPFRAPSRKIRHSCAVYARTGPSGFLESRTPINPLCLATSTQISWPPPPPEDIEPDALMNFAFLKNALVSLGLSMFEPSPLRVRLVYRYPDAVGNSFLEFS